MTMHRLVAEDEDPIDVPREECGVFAVYGESESFDAAAITHNALFSLQHRGQESAGIVVSDGETISMHKGMGLVRQVFTEKTSEASMGTWRSATSGTRQRGRACLSTPSLSTLSAPLARSLSPTMAISQTRPI